MKELLLNLRGGDRRSIGNVDDVVAMVRKNPALFADLVDCMLVDDGLVRMRAADAVEKLSVKNPEILRPFKRLFLGKIAQIEQQEVRWHLAQIIPRLTLTTRQRGSAVRLLSSWLNDQSNIVKTFSMQALADLAADDKNLAARVFPIIAMMTVTGSPAVRSRGRKLLAGFRKNATSEKP